MFVKNYFILFVSYVILFCESAFVDNIQRCSVRDSDCLKEVVQSVIRDTSRTGIPEYGIPPYDPYVIRDEKISVLDILDITLVEGAVRGVRNCVINNFKVNINKGKARLEMTCDINYKGKYKAYGQAEIIKNILGGATVHGDGNCKVTIEKFHMKADYKFYIRNRDGDLYIDNERKDTKTQIDIGKITYAADNLYLGERESSALITDILNQNWKFFMETGGGNAFLDRAGDIIYYEVRKFFNNVPAKYYVADDLSPYVTV